MQHPHVWLIAIGLYLVGTLCVLPTFDLGAATVRHWLTPPPPTPVPAPLGVDSDDAAGLATWYGWLREQRGLTAEADADLEAQAYYLAGEAPRLFAGAPYGTENGFPAWANVQYVVGPANGQWVRAWTGCRACATYRLDGSIRDTYCGDQRPVGVNTYPGLATTNAVGAAMVTRNGIQYVATVWRRTQPWPTPPPLPTTTPAPYTAGPGW